MNSFLVRSLSKPVVRATCSSRRLLSWTAVQDAAQVGSSVTEGDMWDDNYSLTEDGVVNTKLAYRNARVSTVLNNLPVKAKGGKVDIKDVNFQGKYNLVEAGDSDMNHDQFEDVLEEQHDYLSSDKILFFEDFGLGAHAGFRVGGRMISDNPVHALIFRSLMIKIPPRPTDHRARYNGWNLDERWCVTDYNWDGSQFDIVSNQAVHVGPRKGERPVIAFLGGSGANKDALVALQFAQQGGGNGGIAGANIVADGNASIRGVVEAYGVAAAAMINDEIPTSITVPSVASSNGSLTTFFAGNFSDDFVNKVHAKGTLYGAYYNTLSPLGVSAVFGGFIGSAKADSSGSAVASFGPKRSPVVVSGNVTTVDLSPDNAVASPKVVVFVDKSAKSISLDEAAAKLLESCGSDDDAKVAAVKALLSDSKLVVVQSEKDAEKHIV